MAQEQTKRGGGGGEDDDLTGSTAAGQERREKLTEETDDLLDEIDDVLEENAEDFVRAYVQRVDSDLAASRAAGLSQTPPGAPSVPVDLSSFSELLRRQAPHLLPSAGPARRGCRAVGRAAARHHDRRAEIPGRRRGRRSPLHPGQHDRRS